MLINLTHQLSLIKTPGEMIGSSQWTDPWMSS